jgi:lipoate-protein ligase A
LGGRAYPPATWRVLVEDHPRDGAWNLALDEAILRAVAADKAPPTLRLYAWEPAVTLGRGQPASDVDGEALRARGYRLLRRPSGGTAVLHRDELTYSIAVPSDEVRVGAGIVDAYRRLSAPLIGTLQALGVPDVSAVAHPDARGERLPICFALTSDYEITSGGRKVVGSAQMRVKGGALQHGTLPLRGDLARICDVLRCCPDRDWLRARMASLEEVLGRVVTWTEVADALVAALGPTLNVQPRLSVPTPEERAAAEALVEERYGNEAWTFKL